MPAITVATSAPPHPASPPLVAQSKPPPTPSQAWVAVEAYGLRVIASALVNCLSKIFRIGQRVIDLIDMARIRIINAEYPGH